MQYTTCRGERREIIRSELFKGDNQYCRTGASYCDLTHRSSYNSFVWELIGEWAWVTGAVKY